MMWSLKFPLVTQCVQVLLDIQQLQYSLKIKPTFDFEEEQTPKDENKFHMFWYICIMHLSFVNSKYHVHDMTLQTQNLGNQVKVRLTS